MQQGDAPEPGQEGAAEAPRPAAQVTAVGSAVSGAGTPPSVCARGLTSLGPLPAKAELQDAGASGTPLAASLGSGMPRWPC